MSGMLAVPLFVLLLGMASSGSAELHWAGEPHQNRTARQQACLENQQYPHMGFCCRNCEAGTYVKQKCSSDQEKGVCEPCESGTYAEHPTGMEQCLQCSQCHMDQIMTQKCTSRRNTQCECKPGFFCVPDEPCEVCKKCTRCKADEMEERRCTPTSNTKCKKHPPNPHDPTLVPTVPPAPKSNDAVIPVVVVVLLIVIIIIIMVVLLVCHKRKKLTCAKQASPVSHKEEVKININDLPAPSVEEKENSHNAGLEEAEEPRQETSPLLQEASELSKSIPVEDEDRGLGDSLPNTTSSSQTSLSALPITAPPTVESPRDSPRMPRPTCDGEKEPEPWARDEGPPRKLIPLLGEETSLSKSFDLFDSLDVRMHNKFFRSIGLSDNAIKLAESQNAGDKVYELLRIWMQREGLRANINDLLQALLDLDQRYTAEQISSKAVERGYYKYE